MPVPAPVPAPAVQTAPKTALAVPPPADADTIAKARAAMEEKMKDLQAHPPVETAATAPEGAKPMAQPSPRKPKTLKGAPEFPPMQPPPPAVSADKEQRLQELLSKYKADQITPEQYHEQRAKILAEP